VPEWVAPYCATGFTQQTDRLLQPLFSLSLDLPHLTVVNTALCADSTEEHIHNFGK
jgi:hypothetical protein